MSPTEKPRKRVGNPPSKLQKSSRKWMYIALVLIVVAIAIVAFVILQNSSSNTQNNNGTSAGNPIAVIDTSMGVIKVELYEDKVPITAGNFIKNAENGYYDGIIFHRVIKNFMIQGGDPKGDGTGGHAAEYHEGYGDPEDPETWMIPDEFREDLSNVRGTISMANRGPNTGGSQFFINVVDNTHLDYNKEPLTSQHAVFGKVIEGMDIVDAISNVATNANDKPIQDVTIIKVTIDYPQ